MKSDRSEKIRSQAMVGMQVEDMHLEVGHSASHKLTELNWVTNSKALDLSLGPEKA